MHYFLIYELLQLLLVKKITNDIVTINFDVHALKPLKQMVILEKFNHLYLKTKKRLLVSSKTRNILYFRSVSFDRRFPIKKIKAKFMTENQIER